jgi:hypothetical protein
MSTKKNKSSTLDNKISTDSDQSNGQNNDQSQLNNKEDKNSDKYKIALQLINKILVNLGKEEVDDLTKFINIDRDDIIKEVNKNSLEEMDKEIFALYNKKNCGYYRKTDSLVLNCLRGMMKEIGFELSYEKKEKSEYINNKSFRRKHVFYSIK